MDETCSSSLLPSPLSVLFVLGAGTAVRTAGPFPGRCLRVTESATESPQRRAQGSGRASETRVVGRREGRGESQAVRRGG